MLQEIYKEYLLSSNVKKNYLDRFDVGVCICLASDKKSQVLEFFADDRISYILEVEAEKEAINLGKNLVNRGLVGF